MACTALAGLAPSVRQSVTHMAVSTLAAPTPVRSMLARKSRPERKKQCGTQSGAGLACAVRGPQKGVMDSYRLRAQCSPPHPAIRHRYCMPCRRRDHHRRPLPSTSDPELAHTGGPPPVCCPTQQRPPQAMAGAGLRVGVAVRIKPPDLLSSSRTIPLRGQARLQQGRPPQQTGPPGHLPRSPPR